MLLTRSIRRKLAVSLGILFLALAGLFLASLTGLWSYRALVRDLEVAVQVAPRQTELVASFLHLVEPLAIRIPTADQQSESVRLRHARFQRLELEKAIDETEGEVVDYFARLNKFQSLRRVEIPERQKRNQWRSRDQMIETLRLMKSEAGDLEKLRTANASLQFIGDKLALLTQIARNTPEPLADVLPMLTSARTSYRIHFWIVSVAGVIGLVLLVSVVWLATKWVYRPVKKLHAVAKCVAEGNFETRADVCPSNDELSQLGHTLNQMIDRFQASIQDRDHEIHQRTQQIIQNARTVETAFLTAGIAHEVNNPLAGVGYAADSLKDRVQELLEVDEETGHIPTPDERDLKTVNDYLDMICRETARIVELTEKLKDYGRKAPGEDEGERHRYDIAAIVAEVLSLIGHMRRYDDREIVFNAAEPLYAIVVSSQIKQVVLNLVANALDATGPGGRLEITTSQSPDSVELTFTDNGCGMDEKTLEHLFDPFYTTKLGLDGSAKGTGMGLALTHRIVTSHDGTLEAESAGEDQGSTFRLRLPKASASIQAA